MGNFKNENKGFESIPKAVINDHSLSIQARFIYTYMSAKPSGWDFYKAYMAKELNISIDTVCKYVNELINAGWLESKGQQLDHGKFGATEYVLKSRKSPKKKDKINDTVGEIFRNGKNGVQNNINSINDNPINNNDSSINTPIIEKEKNKRLSNDNQKNKYSEEFEHFWKLYDYVRGKQKAYAKWNKLSDADKQKAIDAIPAYKEDCARNKRDMQYAATYLYNHTFEDDFSAKPRRAFYDILESDTDRVKGFKKWMREKFPDIENTCLPLSFEDGKELIERYRTEDVEYVLGEINREFYRYRFKSIAEVAKTMLQDYDEKEDEQ